MFDTVGDHDPTKCNYTLELICFGMPVCCCCCFSFPLDIKCGCNRHNYVHTKNNNNNKEMVRERGRRRNGKVNKWVKIDNATKGYEKIITHIEWTILSICIRCVARNASSLPFWCSLFSVHYIQIHIFLFEIAWDDGDLSYAINTLFFG